MARRLAGVAVLSALLVLAACSGGGPAAPAAAPPAIEIAVERPIDPPGLAALAGAGTGAAGLPAPAAEGLTPRLAVRDIAASAAFYRDLLGFAVEGEEPEANAEHAVLARGAARIALERSGAEEGEGPAPAYQGEEPAIALVLAVADAAALFDRLADRAPLVRGLRDTGRGTREFAVADPDGHVVVLSQAL